MISLGMPIFLQKQESLPLVFSILLLTSLYLSSNITTRVLRRFWMKAFSTYCWYLSFFRYWTPALKEHCGMSVHRHYFIFLNNPIISELYLLILSTPCGRNVAGLVGYRIYRASFQHVVILGNAQKDLAL